MEIHIKKEPVDIIEPLNRNIEIKQIEGNERKLVKTPKEWKKKNQTSPENMFWVQ